MKVIAFIFSLALLLPFQAYCQDVNKAVMEFQELNTLQNASWSIKAKNLTRNSDIISVNSSMSLIPASTMKAITTGIALLELGPEYTFETKIAYSGALKDSILEGNLIIIGGGDPSLGSPDFYDFNVIDKWLGLLKQLGISQIKGDLIVLADHFSGLLTPSTWVYQDLGNYYGASPSSLSCFNNTFRITFGQNAKVGGSTRILSPDNSLGGLNLINEVKSGPKNSGDQAYAYGCPNCDQYTVRGTIPAGLGTFTIKASIPDPPKYFLNSFEEKLRSKNINFEGEKLVLKKYNENYKIIDTVKSAPLTKILHETNVHSNNLFAEHLLLEISRDRVVDNPVEIIENFYKINLNPEGLFAADGSGLSRYNAITTSNHLDLFEFLFNSDQFETYLGTLPEGGKEGTIENMFHSNNGSQYFIKSGTLNRVKAFAGFIRNPSDEILAFSFIVNNFSGKSSEISSEMEKVIMSLSE